MTDRERLYWLDVDINRLEEVKWCIENGEAGNVGAAIDHLAFIQGSECVRTATTAMHAVNEASAKAIRPPYGQAVGDEGPA